MGDYARGLVLTDLLAKGFRYLLIGYLGHNVGNVAEKGVSVD
jgi:hypothetical protein